jgi:hypothetical protein
MDKVVLVRTKYQDKQTLGELNYKGGKLYTLELAWRNNERRVSCIPKGVYKVVPRTSPKYGQHFHVTGVQGRDLILVHHGNFYKDILGCILVGMAHSDINKDGYLDVTSSKVAMGHLLKAHPNGFRLEIIDKEDLKPTSL